MGMAVMPMSPRARATGTRSRRRPRAASAPTPGFAAGPVRRSRRAAGASVRHASRSSPMVTADVSAVDRGLRGLSRNSSAAAAGVTCPYWTFSAVCDQQRADLDVALRRHLRGRAELGAAWSFSKSTVVFMFGVGQRVLHRVRTSRLAGRPRSVPEDLAGLRVVDEEVDDVDHGRCAWRCRRPRSTARPGPTAPWVTRVGDDAERRPWCSSASSGIWLAHMNEVAGLAGDHELLGTSPALATWMTSAGGAALRSRAPSHRSNHLVRSSSVKPSFVAVVEVLALLAQPDPERLVVGARVHACRRPCSRSSADAGRPADELLPAQPICGSSTPSSLHQPSCCRPGPGCSRRAATAGQLAVDLAVVDTGSPGNFDVSSRLPPCTLVRSSVSLRAAYSAEHVVVELEDVRRVAAGGQVGELVDSSRSWPATSP